MKNYPSIDSLRLELINNNYIQYIEIYYNNIHRYGIWCCMRLTKTFKKMIDRITTCMLILLIDTKTEYIFNAFCTG